MPPQAEIDDETDAATPTEPSLLPHESTPLVDHSLCIEDEEVGVIETSCSAESRRGSTRHSLFFNELRGLMKLAIPLVGTYLLEMLPGLVAIILVGHVRHAKTEEYIDATALAVAFMNLTGLSIGIGLSTALDTLCSQAYGAKETEKMGTYLQTGMIVLSVFCLVIGFTFYNATSLLLALRQPEEVSEFAGVAVWTLLPGVPFLFLYELLRKVLQAQNIATPMFFVSAAANIINVSLGYYLVYCTQWGWLGASVSLTICNMSLSLLLLPYILASGLVNTFWSGLRLQEALEGIPTFLSLGVPGMFQLCFEWWAFEVLVIICGLLPNAVVSIGANTIIMNVCAIVYMPYLGVSISGNVRIGNALGAGDAERAKVAAYSTIGLCGAAAFVCAAFLVTFRNALPTLFTHDEGINDLATVLIIVAAIFQIPDSVNGATQGAFRGSGRQNLGATLNFVGYYVCGIPFGCILAFGCNLGVTGLWIGMAVGMSAVAICGSILVTRSDWVKLSQDAKDRVGK